MDPGTRQYRRHDRHSTRRQSLGQDRAQAADDCRRDTLRPSFIRVSIRHQHQECAARHHDVAADVGRRLSGVQRGVPELLSGAVPDAHARLRDGDFAEHRYGGDSAVTRILCVDRAAWINERPIDDRRDHIRNLCHLSNRLHDRARDVQSPYERSR